MTQPQFDAGDDRPPRLDVPDLPLIIEQLQDQIDDLTTALQAQQAQLDQQAVRLAALERR